MITKDTKWEELTKEQQSLWEKITNKYQQGLAIVKGLQDDGCPWCKYKADDFKSMAFHISSTHGFPREVLIDVLKGDIKLSE